MKHLWINIDSMIKHKLFHERCRLNQRDRQPVRSVALRYGLGASQIKSIEQKAVRSRKARVTAFFGTQCNDEH